MKRIVVFTSVLVLSLASMMYCQRLGAHFYELLKPSLNNQPSLANFAQSTSLSNSMEFYQSGVIFSFLVGVIAVVGLLVTLTLMIIRKSRRGVR